MHGWMRRFGTVVDHIAVPVAAAVVGWIVAIHPVVPHAQTLFADSARPGGVLEGSAALLAFGLARRYL